MFITRDPWVTMTLNGIPSAISINVSTAKAHLVVIGAKRGEGDMNYYTPLLDHCLPSPDDQSEFAKLYRTIGSLVERGMLGGPYGEDHPAVFRRFEYPSRSAMPAEVLDELERRGVAVRDLEATFHDEHLVEFGQRSAEEKRLKKEVEGALGHWAERSIVVLPKIREKPRPMTPEERAALYARIDKLMKPSAYLSDLKEAIRGWWRNLWRR